VFLGACLGAVNAFVVALVIGLVHRDAVYILFITLYGVIPGFITGGVLGGVAALLGRSSRHLRSALLAIPAVAAVIALGVAFGMVELVPEAVIPTVAVALVLEHRTRRPAHGIASLPVAKVSPT